MHKDKGAELFSVSDLEMDIEAEHTLRGVSRKQLSNCRAALEETYCSSLGYRIQYKPYAKLIGSAKWADRDLD